MAIVMLKPGDLYMAPLPGKIGIVPCLHSTGQPCQAEGGIANGTRIVKRISEAGDRSPVGALGTVLASFPKETGVKFIGYFVEWDSIPNCAFFMSGAKINCLEE